MFVLVSQPAYALIDDYSTGPGKGSSDQLDDVWQAVFNGWGLSVDGDEDFDGCSNLVECVAGSDPWKAGDCLKVGDMVIGGANIIMNFSAKAGKAYQVWESTSPGGPPPGEPGSQWTLKPGASKVAMTDGMDSIVFAKAADVSRFYRLESKDHDSDGDGVSDWAERVMGTDIASASSSNNASGGVASDLDTLKSLLSLEASPGVAEAYEKEGTKATIRLRRTFGTMPLTVNLSGFAGASDIKKASASSTDFLFQNSAGVMTNSVTLPQNQGVSEAYEVAKVVAVKDDDVEVPEHLKVCITFPGAPPGTTGPEATVQLKDADPTKTGNRVLYVAFLGREAGITSTASGYATALVEGDNTRALISVVFNNLSSDQNTAYIRIGPDLEVQVLPLGQVSGATWDIRAAQTELTDQKMLDALLAGRLYVSITTVNYPEKEIYGYFNHANGSVMFDESRADLASPTLGSVLWQTPNNEALEREIWRFMNQATFGGTTALYQEIRAKVDAAISGGGTYIDGLSAWLDEQMNPALTPSVSQRQLVMAADMEEFALRGNKPITYNADPQLNGGSIGISYVNGMPVASTGSPNTNDPGVNYPQNSPNLRREWWTMVTQSKDQLRQRVAQALSEICVISERDATVLTWHYGTANWWDMLANGAFGKFRTLLEQVSLNPMMGVYLTSVANRATYEASPGLIISPDENYAREIMQLFSIGLVLRHPDGSLQLDAEGLPIATYDNNDIMELARVFTGFSHGARHGLARADRMTSYGGVSTTDQRISPTIYANGTTNNTWFGRDNGHLYWQTPWIHPMKVIGRLGTTVYHDFNVYTFQDTSVTPPISVQVPGVGKRLLAGKHGQYQISHWNPVGQTDSATHDRAALEVSQAHDCLAGVASAATYGAGTQASPGHTNTPVNISRWLIQRLVTSNPSSGYIYRVQKVYRDTNGTLGPVIKAILLDHEARSLQLADNSISYGKVKEPLVHFAHILRLFKAYSGAPVSILSEMETGFSDTDAPMDRYPASELAKFSLANANPPSKPTGWKDGPFRLRLESLRSSLGQSPLDAPSVFNWFYPDFTVPGRIAQAGLVAPEMQTITEGAEIAKINFLYSYMWMTLAHMATQPGTGTSVADFIFRNGWATPAARFSTNGGTTLMGWPASIVLNESNWNTGVTVTMVPVNDRQFNQMASSQVRYALSGTAPGYGGISTLPLDLSFVDNEVKNERLVIKQSSGYTWVQEGGMTDTLEVKLSAPPAVGATVVVTPALQNNQVTLNPVTLSFDHSNWNTYQVITVTAVNDSVVENSGTADDVITLNVSSAAAANYDGISTAPISVGVVDNDGGLGVLITQSGNTTEVAETGATSGVGTDSYTIVLTKAPTANVVVNIVSNGQLSVNTSTGGTTFTAGSTSRTFTTTNWNQPQAVVVRGNDDATSENTHTGTITHSITSSTGGYTAGLPIQQIVGRIEDNDNSIIVTHSDDETIVMEGTEPLVTDTLTVRLRSNPNAQVSVTLSSAQLKFTPSTLTFDPTGTVGGNLWSVDQTVVVSANDDYINEGLHTSSISAYSQSAGSNFNGSSGGTAIVATVIDNDDARLIVRQTDESTVVGENGLTDTYSLVLGRRPKTGSSVTVTLSGFSSSLTISPAGPFVFDETNWNTPQVIQLSTPNDSTVETTATTNITHNVSSSDPTYHNSSVPVLTVTMLDNEPVLNVTQTNIYTTVREGGVAGLGGTPAVQDTFTVAPARGATTGTTLTVTLVADGQVSVTPSVLTFASGSTTAQTVTVTALDDTVEEAIVHPSVIVFNIASTDSYYNGASVAPVIAYVTDNDTPGISLVESGGTTANTEGSTTQDSFTVALSKQPTANVNVNVWGDQTLFSKSGTPTLTSVVMNFTPANWSTPQTVNVLAFNDLLPELRHLGKIHTAITPDSAAEYVALPAESLPKIDHIITDNDNNVAGNVVRLVESSSFTSVTESSTSDTFTVVLSQQPTAPVTITFTPDSQLAVTPTSVTFVPGTTGPGIFSATQTITVRAVDDSLLEPILHWGVITSSAVSEDPVFNGVSITPLISTVYDNDGPSVIVLASGGSTILTENGRKDDYTVSLSHAPTANVTIQIMPDSQLMADATSMTFTSENWSTPQKVTLTAVNDDLAETITHNGVVSHAVSSADKTFNGLGATIITAQIWDNDVPSLDVSHAGTDPTSTILTEGGANDAIVFRLNQPPAAGTSVTVTLYPPAFYVPPPQHGKIAGYFVNDLGGNNNRDNIVIDYTDSIVKYRRTFYDTLSNHYGVNIPTPPDAEELKKAHWSASVAVIDQMDLWLNGGALKARYPVIYGPDYVGPVPPTNPRQAVIEAIYAHSGGDNLPTTTRYEEEIPFNPKSPSTTTFANEVRDRVRWAGYLMSVGAPGLISH